VLSATDAWLSAAGDTYYVGFLTQLIQWSKGPKSQCPLWVKNVCVTPESGH